MMHPTLNTLKNANFCVLYENKSCDLICSYLVVINVCRNTIYSNKYVLVKNQTSVYFGLLPLASILRHCLLESQQNAIQLKKISYLNILWWLVTMDIELSSSPRLLHTPFERLFGASHFHNCSKFVIWKKFNINCTNCPDTLRSPYTYTAAAMIIILPLFHYFRLFSLFK